MSETGTELLKLMTSETKAAYAIVSSQWLRTAPNNRSSLMAPMTAQKMIDIQSNAARLLPKPMPPSAAKMTMTIMRKENRTTIRVDRNSCERLESCAKLQNSGVRGVVSSHARCGLGQPLLPSRWPERHLKTRWGEGCGNKRFISADEPCRSTAL